MSIAEAEAWLCALQMEAAAYAIDEWKLLFGSLVAAAPEIQVTLKRHDVPVDLILTRHSRRHRTVRRVKDHPDESRLDALARRLEDICESMDRIGNKGIRADVRAVLARLRQPLR